MPLFIYSGYEHSAVNVCTSVRSADCESQRSRRVHGFRQLADLRSVKLITFHWLCLHEDIVFPVWVRVTRLDVLILVSQARLVIV